MKKNKKNKPLGIGLEALIPKYQTDDDSPNQYIDHVSIDKIIPNKNQPRQIFVEDGMNEFIDSIKDSISLAHDKNIKIHTPLMHLNKAKIWKLAK